VKQYRETLTHQFQVVCDQLDGGLVTTVKRCSEAIEAVAQMQAQAGDASRAVKASQQKNEELSQHRDATAIFF